PPNSLFRSPLSRYGTGGCCMIKKTWFVSGKLAHGITVWPLSKRVKGVMPGAGGNVIRPVVQVSRGAFTVAEVHRSKSQAGRLQSNHKPSGMTCTPAGVAAATPQIPVFNGGASKVSLRATDPEL